MSNYSASKTYLSCWFLRLSFLICVALLTRIAYSSDQIQYIDIHQAKIMHEQGVLFVDTRSWFERKLGIIPDALAMEVPEVEDIAQYLITDKSKPVVLYCATGSRASQAASKLKSMGYESIQVIANGQGFSSWQKAGYPVSR